MAAAARTTVTEAEGGSLRHRPPGSVAAPTELGEPGIPVRRPAQQAAAADRSGVECPARDVRPTVVDMHLLHIAHQADWQRALDAGRYEVSTRGRTLGEVGFIHASYPDQVQDVARYVFAGDPQSLCVLVVDEALVTGAGVRVELEDGGDGELYPHIYGAIDRSWVVDVRPAEFDDAGHLRY